MRLSNFSELSAYASLTRSSSTHSFMTSRVAAVRPPGRGNETDQDVLGYIRKYVKPLTPARLLANVGIVLVFAAFYLRFLAAFRGNPVRCSYGLSRPNFSRGKRLNTSRAT